MHRFIINTTVVTGLNSLLRLVAIRRIIGTHTGFLPTSIKILVNFYREDIQLNHWEQFEFILWQNLQDCNEKGETVGTVSLDPMGSAAILDNVDVLDRNLWVSRKQERLQKAVRIQKVITLKTKTGGE